MNPSLRDDVAVPQYDGCDRDCDDAGVQPSFARFCEYLGMAPEAAHGYNLFWVLGGPPKSTLTF